MTDQNRNLLADAQSRVLAAEVSADQQVVSVDRCANLVEAAHVGAVVTFGGIVRNHDGGKGVLWLTYTAHPLAQQTLRSVALSIAKDYPAVTLAVAHRTGNLVVGDVALAAAVASPHRAEAFAACAELIERIKTEVQIWKEQGFTDGTKEWVAALG